MALEVKNKKWLGYIVYVVLVAVILLYYLFPAQAVEEFVNRSVSRINPELAFQADRIGPALPAGLRINSGQVYMGSPAGVSVLKADSMYIGPRILKLFKGDSGIDITGTAYKGDFKGTVQVEDSDGESFASSLTFNNFSVADYELLAEKFSHKIIGNLSGDVSFNKDSKSPGGNGKAELRLRDGQLQFKTPIFGISSVDLQKIEIEMALRSKEITVVRAAMEGSEVTGAMTGSIHLQPDINLSQLNLKGTLEPQAEFYKNYPEIRELLKSMKKKVKRGQYFFSITGTLGEPKFRLQ